MASLTNAQKIENGLVIAALLLCIVWAVGDNWGIDFPRWYDIVASLCLFALMVFTLVSSDLKRRRYIKGLESWRDQPCVNCGMSWHTKDANVADAPLVFSSRRVAGTGCACVDGHEHDCPNAPI